MGNHLTKNRGSSSPSTGSVNSTNRFTISTPPRTTRSNNHNGSRSVTTIVRGEFNVAIEEHHHEFNDDDNDSGTSNNKATTKRNDNERNRTARPADTPVSSSKKLQAKRKNEQPNNNEQKKRKFSQTKLDFIPSPVRNKNTTGTKPEGVAVASPANKTKASSSKSGMKSNVTNPKKDNIKLINKTTSSMKGSKADLTLDFSDETDDDDRKPAARPTSQKSDDERKPAARPTSQKFDDKKKPAARSINQKSDENKKNTGAKNVRSNIPEQPPSTEKTSTTASFEKKPEYQRIYKIVKELYKQRMDAELNYKEDKFKQLIGTNSTVDSNGLIAVKKEHNLHESTGTEPQQPLISESSVVSNNVIRIDRDISSHNQKQLKITHHFPRPSSKQQQSIIVSEVCPKIILPHKNKNKDDYFTKNKFSVHLYSSYAVEDEEELNYVPFLDESFTNNDRLGQLLQDYNFDERLKDIAFGGNTMIREYITTHMKAILKEIFYRKNPEFHQDEESKMYVFYALEKIFKLSDVIEKIKEHYNEVCRECLDSFVSRESDGNPSDAVSGRPLLPRKARQGVLHGSVIKNESDPPEKVNEIKREVDSSIGNDRDRLSDKANRESSRKHNNDSAKNKAVETDSDSCIIIDDCNDEEDTSTSSDGCVIIEDMNRHLGTYEKAVSTYRVLWCRLCYQMDCNIHGYFFKAELKTQYDINMQRDPTSSLCAKWNMNTNGIAGRHAFWRKADALFQEKLNEINQSLVMSTSLTPESSIRDTVQPNNQDTNELTTFQKSIIGRVYQIYEGDVDRIAKILRASVPIVQNYISMFPSEFPSSRVKLKTKLPTRNRKIPYFSTRNYRSSIYEANTKTGIAPFCSPCSHAGTCSSDNCDCINNRLFCTLACTINSDSVNFFRGCDCAGNCSTIRCTCYLANRECDPDLCVCVTCIDPPYQIEVKKQKCCNDRIYMNRAHPMLIGKSGIAGLGLFNKFDLKKGDYVGEYIGEKITQEEADRRGQFYDALKLSYMFTLASDVTLDAMRKGNKSRFINHSETPNLDVKTIFVRGEQRIGFYARYDIKAQSELFFDYQYNKNLSNDFIEKAAFQFDWMNDTHNATDASKEPGNQGMESRTAQAKKKPAPKKKTTKAKSATSKKSSKSAKQSGAKKK